MGSDTLNNGQLTNLDDDGQNDSNGQQYLTAILSSSDLPSAPQVASQVVEFASREDGTIQEFLAIVEADVAIAAKIIRYANSPAYSASRFQVVDLKAAVVQIGIETAQVLALSFSISRVTKNVRGSFDQNFYMQHSVGSAVTARALAKRANQNQDKAFLTGLIGHIGHLAFASVMPAEYASLRDEICQAESVPRNAMDIQAKSKYGFTFHELGHELLKAWGFADDISNAILKMSGDLENDPFVNVMVAAQRITDIVVGDISRVSRVDNIKEFLDSIVPSKDHEELFDEVVETWEAYFDLFEIEMTAELVDQLSTAANQLLLDNIDTF